MQIEKQDLTRNVQLGYDQAYEFNFCFQLKHDIFCNILAKLPSLLKIHHYANQKCIKLLMFMDIYEEIENQYTY